MDWKVWAIGFLGSTSLSMFSFLLGRISMNRKIEMLAEQIRIIAERLSRIEGRLNGNHP